MIRHVLRCNNAFDEGSRKTLPTVEQQPAIEAQAVEQQAYERRNQHTAVRGDLSLRAPPPPLNPNSTNDAGSTVFRCDHPGCRAAPFQAQYLLKCVVPLFP
jgi:hypothetical protein